MRPLSSMPGHARQNNLEAGEIGDIRAVRMHVNTGTGDSSWKVPLSAWLWRFNEKQCGGGPMVFDHGYHLFSLAYYLGGSGGESLCLDRPYPGEGGRGDRQDRRPGGDHVPVQGLHRYGLLDIEHTPRCAFIRITMPTITGSR